jgi:hypothetical protein
LQLCEGLNGFRPPTLCSVAFSDAFGQRISIKDMTESFGVQLMEVDNTLLDGKPVDFSCILQDGDLTCLVF